MAHMHGRRDAVGSTLGLVVFLGGVGLLALTFQLAYRMFSVSPSKALQTHPGQPLDLGLAGSTFAGLLLQIFLLLVMGVMGSLVANRGIHLYTESRARHVTHIETTSVASQPVDVKTV